MEIETQAGKVPVERRRRYKCGSLFLEATLYNREKDTMHEVENHLFVYLTESDEPRTRSGVTREIVDEAVDGLRERLDDQGHDEMVIVGVEISERSSVWRTDYSDAENVVDQIREEK